MPRHRPRPAWQVADFFALEGEAEVYLAVVDACVAEPAAARRLSVRPQATAESTRAAMLTEANVARAVEPCRDTQEHFRSLLERRERRRRRLDYLRNGTHPATVLLASTTLLTLLFLAFASWTTALAGAVIPLLTATAVWRHPVWRMSVLLNLQEWRLRPALLLLSRRTAWAEAAWRRDLQENGVRPLVARVVEALLGEDHDSLLLADSYDGLRSPRNPQYVIDSPAARSLARKITQLESGGTIAVSGSRGVGKSTLLETCANEAGFAVVVQAPATYSPYDFLLSLYVRTCERYLVHRGYVPPAFVRLSTFRRAAHRLFPALRNTLTLLAFGLAAGALVVLGLAASARSLATRYERPLRAQVAEYGHRAADVVADVWRGERIGTAVLVVVAGVALWSLRRWSRWADLRRGARYGLVAIGGLLVMAAFVSLFFDGAVRSAVGKIGDDRPSALLLLVALTGLANVMPDRQWELRGRVFLGTVARGRIAVGMLLVSLALLLTRPVAQAIVTDPENPLRLACVLAGLLLVKAGSWTPPDPTPPLVTACRDELYRLQTMQTASSAVTAGAAQLLTTHTASLSTLPPNFPELVSDFRDLLTGIAAEQHRQEERVVIAIDELDRLGSDTQALAFLNEIKAILGVPHVHYLISVAEDVGASFVRRGLPHRGVTDSSLDDIVHVLPCTLEESKKILGRRASGLSEPYKVLTHALSGGIPRDLIRYGLRLDEITSKTQLIELTDISRQLILEELADTLAGFRTLLSKQQWTPRTSALLIAFRNLTGQLRAGCPCVSPELRRALEHVAFHDLHRHLGEEAAAEIPDVARNLIDEASAYVLFSLTLLDVFGEGDLARRRDEAASRGPEGDLDLLGQARQELEVSPYSARQLIGSIRTAWRLPEGPAGGLPPTVPPARSPGCPRHPRPAN
ncbi:P-loop NTPase fold protein [Streptomyces sp. NBC_00105]|uniref:P-loop NTPase fold protein n=1 Tax=unclassified Streptomyces TaxID=2593676 RepID=UPI002886E1A5|nr:P-loop NTPase fold protein [Streptomyces sp. DSM 41633]